MRVLRLVKYAIRRYAWNYIPHAVRSYVALRCAGYWKNPNAYIFDVVSKKDFFVMRFAKDREFKATPKLKKRAEFQMVKNGDCVDETRSFLKLSNSHRVLFDIGAADGIFSLLHCNAHPQNQSVAYEPSEVLMHELKSNMSLNALNDRVTYRQIAVGKEGVNTQMYLGDRNYVRPFSSTKNATKLEVPTTTLDSDCSKLHLVPNIIKIDVEGYEYEVLLGAKVVINQHKPLIFLELHLNELERIHNRSKDILEWLINQGYGLYSFTDQELRQSQVINSLKSVYRLIAKYKA
ncbi:MAG: FkbM family methyltransferase [Candidatus Omnitrophota bacterium]|jgi:FkbM family methyltransferase